MEEPLWKQRLRACVKNDPRGMKGISLAAGQGETFVRDILKRERIPSIENFMTLAEILGTTVSELIGEVEPGVLHMGRPPNIESQRFHYIPEWAERRQLSQADIARELGVNKSSVSHWFEGAIPAGENLIPLTALLTGNGDEPAALFRHPDDDWMARLLRGRSADEKDRIKAMIEIAFPRAA